MRDQKVSELATPELYEEPGSKKYERILIVFSALILVTFLFWANQATLNEVSEVNGEIVTESSPHIVEHKSGGVVRKVFVVEGQFVKKGDTLLELSEEDNQDEIEILKVQLKNLYRKRSHAEGEYWARMALIREGLAPRVDVYGLRSKRAEISGQISETKRRIQLLSTKLNDLQINAPITGIIHNFKDIASSSVIKSGQAILEIMPIDTPLVAEIEIPPKEIGHMHPGQKVKLKFTTYDFSRYGHLEAMLDSISPYTFFDEQGKSFYRGMVKLPKNYITSPEETRIIPGMTLSAEVMTGSKTLIEYILKPIFASARQALREK